MKNFTHFTECLFNLFSEFQILFNNLNPSSYVYVFLFVIRLLPHQEVKKQEENR